MTAYKSMGFWRVAAAVPAVRPADVVFNVDAAADVVQRAAAEGASVVVLPELCITGYTSADLFGQQLLLDAAEEGLLDFAARTSELPITSIVGLPIAHDGATYNCAAVVCRGRVLGLVPKSYIPNNQEFYERRWFASGLGISIFVRLGEYDVPFGTDLMFRTPCGVFGIEICEDLWVACPPSTYMAAAGADIIFNLSASDELVGKHSYLTNLVRQQSARLRAGYVYSSAGFGESTTDLVFAGNVLVAEDGVMLTEGERFRLEPQVVVADVDVMSLRHDRRCTSAFADCARSLAKDFRIIDMDSRCEEPSAPWRRHITRLPFVPSEDKVLADRCAEISDIQAEGLMRRLSATGCRNVTVGVSGGLDSTLALLVCVRAFDRLGLERSGITAVTMPGFGTTERTHSNAVTIMERLGVTLREIPIGCEAELHFGMIGHDAAVHDVTYENVQARIRTLILMNVANQSGGMVVGTGDLSELALGWCTYNGDQMSMYGVNASVPKTLVRYLVGWYAGEAETADPVLSAALRDIIATPVSPELLPSSPSGDIVQKTEDLVGPYELHDFFLYHTLRHGFPPRRIYSMALQAFGGEFAPNVVAHWLKTFYRRFFAQQFKRSCMPDGPKVGSVSLSPRGDWRMPSDASAALWMSEAATLG